MTPITTQQTSQQTSQPPIPSSDMTSPYRGLTPYTEADAAYFFGRTAEITTITANLEVARLTLFYGPSGVGKSSVLRAGVIHQLNQRARENFAALGTPEQIPIYFNRWASDPLLGLSQALAAAVAPYLTPPNLPLGGGTQPPLPASTGGWRGGTDVASTRRWLPPPRPEGTRLGAREGWGGVPLLDQLQHWCTQTNSELLLVLDQFEEFFQYHMPQPGAAWEPGGFGAQLVQIVNHSALPVNVLLSLRDDALARLDYFQGRIPALLDNRLSIGHLGRQAGEEAIRQPLAQYNREHNTHYTPEDDLVTAVLDQVGSGQVALRRQGTGGRNTETTAVANRIEAPYLQLVLTRLWQQEGRNGSPALRLTTLDTQLGGAETIVRNYLDNTLDALAPADQELAASFFDRLVTPSGTKIALTLSELTHYAMAASDSVEKVLQQLQARRLLRPVQAPSGVTQYEIFHDVLAPALLDWQARYQKAQEEQQRLAEEQAARTVAEAQARTAEERAYLQEKARNAAENLAQAEAKNARQLRRLIFGLVAVLLIAIATTIFAIIRTRLATGFSLTLEARNFVRAQNLRMATLLALEAQQLNPSQGEPVLETEIPLQVPYILSNPLFGHSAAVWSMAWRPDGQQLASASNDNTVIVWDAASGEQVATLQGHRDDVLSVVWRPDGQQLASASWDKTVIVWDAASGERVATLQGHRAAVWSVAWRPDSQQLASASDDKTVIVWDAASGERVATLQGHSDDVLSVVWRPDGQQLASASNDNTVIVWDAASGERVTTLQGHRDAVRSVAWRPDGQQLASASNDNTVIVWDAASGERVTTLQGHRDAVRSVAWRPDGQQLASASNDNTVIVWDAASGERVATLQGHSDDVLSVVWRPDGQQLASASWDKTVIVWDAASGERVATLQGHSDDVLSVVWRPDGQQLASASWDKTVIVWDAASGERVATLQGHSDDVLSVVWRPDGQQLASASNDNTVIVWDAASGERVATLQGHSAAVRSVAWRPDGQQLASASNDKTVIVWDAASGERVATLQGHRDDVRSVAWRPDGQQLASASWDKTVIVWDAASGERVTTLQGHRDAVLSVAWRPDGQQLASASNDNTVIVWDAASGERVATLQGHSDDVLSVVWRPDGQQLASASWDKTVIVWDAASGERVTTLQGHRDAVLSVAWRPDGQQLASASNNNTILLYPRVYLEPPCAWAWSNLTPDEWVRYRGWAIYRPTCPEYASPKLPGIVESFNKGPEYLLISWKGRLFLSGVLFVGLLIIMLSIWGVIWAVRQTE